MAKTTGYIGLWKCEHPEYIIDWIQNHFYSQRCDFLFEADGQTYQGIYVDISYRVIYYYTDKNNYSGSRIGVYTKDSGWFVPTKKIIMLLEELEDNRDYTGLFLNFISKVESPQYDEYMANGSTLKRLAETIRSCTNQTASLSLSDYYKKIGEIYQKAKETGYTQGINAEIVPTWNLLQSNSQCEMYGYGQPGYEDNPQVGPVTEIPLKDLFSERVINGTTYCLSYANASIYEYLPENTELMKITPYAAIRYKNGETKSFEGKKVSFTCTDDLRGGALILCGFTFNQGLGEQGGPFTYEGFMLNEGESRREFRQPLITAQEASAIINQ